MNAEEREAEALRIQGLTLTYTVTPLKGIDEKHEEPSANGKVGEDHRANTEAPRGSAKQ